MRVQREFGKSNVGVLLTDREFAGSYNRVAALDTRLKLDAHLDVARPGDDQPDARSGWRAQRRPMRTTSTYVTRSRKWFYDLQLHRPRRGLPHGVGFVPRVNMRQMQQFCEPALPSQEQSAALLGPEPRYAGEFGSQRRAAGLARQSGDSTWNSRDPLSGAYHAEIFERFQNINFRRHDTGIGLHTEYFKRATFDINYSQTERASTTTPRPVWRRSWQWQRTAGADHAAADGAAEDRRDLLSDAAADAAQRPSASSSITWRDRAQLSVHARAFAAHDRGLQRRAAESRR